MHERSITHISKQCWHLICIITSINLAELWEELAYVHPCMIGTRLQMSYSVGVLNTIKLNHKFTQITVLQISLNTNPYFRKQINLNYFLRHKFARWKVCSWFPAKCKTPTCRRSRRLTHWITDNINLCYYEAHLDTLSQCINDLEVSHVYNGT